jgi:phage terminase small subunit
MAITQKITSRVQLFIDDIVKGVSATDAYLNNFKCEKFKRERVYAAAHQLRHSPVVAAEIDRRLAESRERSIKSVADIANEFIRIGFADPGDVVQHRRLCCRHCWGVNHKYQWIDATEYAHAVRIAEQANVGKRGRARTPIPDDDGGYEFKFNRPPHPECPHCLGEGKPDVFITDTTKMTPEQRRLIERVKVTKDGIEIRFRNQQDALAKAGQMLGGFKNVVVLQNPDGSPINGGPAVGAMPPEEAAAKYMEWMKGK